MALSISALAGYVEENAFELLSKAVLESSLSNYIQVRAGLQGNQVDIPLLADDFNTGAYTVGTNMGQNYDTCGWAANGTTTISQVRMALYHAKVQRAFCVQTLRDTFMSRQLSAGAAAGAEALPFEAQAAEYFTKGVSKFNEYYLINGAASVTESVSGDSNTITFKGLKGLAAASSAMDKFNDLAQGQLVLPWTSGASVADTSINALEGAQAMITAADARIMLAEDAILVVGFEDYKALVQAMVNANFYHYTGDVREVIIPGTTVRVVPALGVVKSSAIGYENRNFRFLTTGANIIMGTDLTSDFDEFKVWYSQDNDEVRSSMKWTVGVAVIEDELCVSVNDTPADA